MRIYKLSILLAFSLSITLNANARNNPDEKKNSGVKAKAAGCAPAQTLTQFVFGGNPVNNVRTGAETGGHTWYDRGSQQPLYEVPAGGGAHAIFAGALWMGGLDPAGNLKLAAIRFREGNDFWPGPLTLDGTAEISPEICSQWDRHFFISRQEVEIHRYFNTLVAQGLDPFEDPLFADGYTIPQNILNWPAHGNTSTGQNRIVAPFKDFVDPESGEIVGTPGLYEPELGDYPLYDLDDDIDCRYRLVTDPVPMFGDVTMYWVFNDKGNVHTESGGDPIGMEIQAQMFAFSTNDEINNMTFCNYVLINRGTLTLTNTYFGQWVDVDLGNYIDDYVGCDVGRGMGYAYNGDNFDDASTAGPGYGEQPPAIGVDFFEGPYQDADGINNEYGIGSGEALNGLGYANDPSDLAVDTLGGDSIVDNERFGMRRFLYHNNATGHINTQDPVNAVEYYNYLRGLWRNGTPMTYGGTGYNPADPGAIQADFMFPGNTDPLNWGTDGVEPNFADPNGWTEESVPNEEGDRRFIQSAGPFTLDPGEFNNITVGVVYGRAKTGGPFASVDALNVADDKAQSLFENCFRLLGGPDAPELTHQELDREIILYLSNNNTISNNYDELYEEIDPTIPPTDIEGNEVDRTYRFQGYQIYQLKNSTVASSDIDDEELARLVFQVDIEDYDEFGNPIGQIVNYVTNESIGLPVPSEMVNGTNEGIRHSFRVTTDQFASGDTRLVNFKKYYFVAVAYAYNNYEDYHPVELTGQAFPYLRGRSSSTGAAIQTIVAIPHIPAPEAYGTTFNSAYGDGVQISRIEGRGNGGNELELSQETIDRIIDGPPYKADRLEYITGKGPLNVKIVDPLNVKDARFKLNMYPEGDEWEWYLVSLNNTEDTIFSQRSIATQNEQLIPEYGISIDLVQYEYEFDQKLSNDVLIDINIRPELINSEKINTGEDWFGGFPDQEGNSLFNWIRSGIVSEECDNAVYPSPCFVNAANQIDPCLFNDKIDFDNNQIYENVLEGTFAPARLLSAYNCGLSPLSSQAVASLSNSSPDLTNLSSVQIVLTPDKDKWSRVPVLETQGNSAYSQGGAGKLQLRQALSVDKNGRNQNHPDVNYDEATYFGQQITNSELSYGMGWFPGYAVNLETGERLNMAFGEDSYLASDNGKDMLWNPTARPTTVLGDNIVGGGQHFIYIFRNNQLHTGVENNMPNYDAGQFAFENVNYSGSPSQNKVFWALEWVGFPRINPGFEYRSVEDGLVPSEVRLRISVAKPYERYATVADELEEDTPAYVPVDEHLDLSDNNWYPSYEFSTVGAGAALDVAEVAEEALDLINIVPNPYYAYSAYEESRVDNRVKFTNLPPECKIQIFTISGNLVRVLEKDGPSTWLDWDMRNEDFIPIAGGIYIIHVAAPGYGEKVLKFFAATRPADLNNF